MVLNEAKIRQCLRIGVVKLDYWYIQQQPVI
jgi:hypothetical protein